MALQRFLILDDSSANTLFFEMLLKEMGIEHVTVASTGDQALELADKNHIQFFIAAWELRGLPGTVFIQRVRSKRKRKFAPCLIYSKRMGSDDVQLTKDLGFKDILSMPFDKDTVRAQIKGMIDFENNLDPLEARLRKIEIYAADQPMEAFKLLDEGMFKPGPYQVRALLSAAEVYIGISKQDKAERCLADALAIDPENVRGLQLKARLHSRRGQHAEAIAILEALVTKSPKNIGSKVSLGAAYLEDKQVDKAKAIFDSVMKMDSSNQDAKDQMATIAMQEGNFTLAEELIAETENGTELARVFNNLAISQVGQGNFDQAILTYNKSMQMLSDKAKLHLLHFNLGLAYRKKGQLEASFKSFAEAYLADASYERAYSAVITSASELKAKGQKLDPEVVMSVKQHRREALKPR